jgi:hypothetical protein
MGAGADKNLRSGATRTRQHRVRSRPDLFDFSMSFGSQIRVKVTELDRRAAAHPDYCAFSITETRAQQSFRGRQLARDKPCRVCLVKTGKRARNVQSPERSFHGLDAIESVRSCKPASSSRQGLSPKRACRL